ncbi:MAG TPA: response regulator [Phycisphaerae bacterium]|nr:response regulator [Phycisphaerae bacterium]HRW53365.1 response regulator [Phycisphaerae bacterium]
MTPVRLKQATVLLVEDDPADQELTRRALTEGAVKIDLRIANDGEEAIEQLIGATRDTADADDLPDIVLLDLNMPRMNGTEVLQVMRDTPALKEVPVVVLTTSKQEEEIVQSYRLGCNSFITKPVNYRDFIEVVKCLGHYWFELCSLPGATERG